MAAAHLVLEEEGGVSMRRLADRLGIRAPSLYKHLPGKPALEAAMISEGFEAAAPLPPHVRGPLPRDRLLPGVEARAAAPVIAAAGDPDRARALFAFAHGMVILELDDRFPPGADLEAAWANGLSALAGAR